MMKQRQYMFVAFSLIVGGVALEISGCASNRPSGTRVKQVEHEAVMTVEAIDVPNRLVTVRRSSGDSLTVYVDESKKDFPQAAVGDQVRIRFVESIALRLTKPSATTGELTVKEATIQPNPDRPRGIAATEVTAIARIETVNQDGSVVTFTGPRGRRTIHVKDASMRDFVRQLRSGDKVEVTYNEAIALSLEKVRH